MTSKYIHPNKIVLGETYLFKRIFNASTITWEPAMVLERKQIGGRDGFMVRWLLDYILDEFKTCYVTKFGMSSEVQICKALTASWVKHEYNKASVNLQVAQKKVAMLEALSFTTKE